jgi:hypothetical protein
MPDQDAAIRRWKECRNEGSPDVTISEPVVKPTRQAPQFVAVALLLGTHSSDSLALDLSVTARAEAGLDPATRNFIATLPDTWRPQLAAIVNDTMHRVDISFDSYVQQIDKLISDQIIDVQCHVLATEKGAVDDIVGRFPWAKPGGPLEKLRDQIAKDDERRVATSSPTFIKTLYDDHTVAASVVACQAGGVAIAASDAKAIMADYSRRWLVWNRLETLQCGSATDCIVTYRIEVEALSQKADARDVASSGARNELSALRNRKTSGWASWFATSPEFGQLESVLTKLFYIENAIGGARAVREASALAKLSHAATAIDEAAKQTGAAFDKIKLRLRAPALVMQPSASGMFNFAGNPFHLSCEQAFAASSADLARAGTLLEDARKELTEARALSSIVQEEADVDIGRATNQSKRTKDAATFCIG